MKIFHNFIENALKKLRVIIIFIIMFFVTSSHDSKTKKQELFQPVATVSLFAQTAKASTRKKVGAYRTSFDFFSLC